MKDFFLQILRNKKLQNLELSAFVFLLLLNPSIDPDWGWHFKYGEFFLRNHRILLENTFSYTMSDYKWVNHSWGYDILLYILFLKLGFMGLSVASAFLGVVSFNFLIKNFSLKLWQKFIAAGIFVHLSWGIFWQGLRSQVIGFFFLSLIIYFIVLYRKTPFYILILPFVFLIWANMHGSFALGIGALIIFLLAEFCKELLKQRSHLNSFFIPKNVYLTFVSVLLSCIATLFNPFGLSIYLEAFSRLSSPYLQVVEEWRSISIISPLGLVLGAYFISLIIFTIWKKTLNNFTYGSFAVLGAILSFHSLRFVGLGIILSFPLLLAVLQEVNIQKRVLKLIVIVVLFILVIDFFMETFNKKNQLVFSYRDYCRVSSLCSEDLVQKLLKQPPSGKGFNSYGTGGYLIGRGVKSKVFIDGRMHLWEKGGYSVFEDYIKIYFDIDKNTFKKYNFQWVITESHSHLSQQLASGEMGNWKLKFNDNYLAYFTRE